MIHIKYGSTRIVFIVANSFVIKFPRFCIQESLVKFRHHKKNFTTKFIIKKYGFCSLFFEPYGLLLEGVIANRQERIFYKRTKHSFCVPTWFSFFGLLNIQPFKRIISNKLEDKMQATLRDILKERQLGIYSGSIHTISNFENYSVDKGKVKMNDYGNIRMLYFITKYGKLVQDGFPKELLE